VDNALNAIKGGGACQLREKVLAEAAETWIIVADYRKNSDRLGTTVCPFQSSDREHQNLETVVIVSSRNPRSIKTLLISPIVDSRNTN